MSKKYIMTSSFAFNDSESIEQLYIVIVTFIFVMLLLLSDIDHMSSPYLGNGAVLNPTFDTVGW